MRPSGTSYFKDLYEQVGNLQIRNEKDVWLNSAILRLLNVDFLKWVAIGIILGIPLGWYFMNRWLADMAGHPQPFRGIIKV